MSKFIKNFSTQKFNNDVETIYANNGIIKHKLYKPSSLTFDLSHSTEIPYEKNEEDIEKQKIEYDNIGFEDRFTLARSFINPFENTGKGIFINRSAVKMLEMANEFNLLNENTKNVADLCSAPGGFSECILSILKWSANVAALSLQASEGTKFNYDKFNKSSPKESYFVYNGKDNSGDITKREVVLEFKEFIEENFKFKCDLVTSDGAYVYNDYSDEISSKQIIYHECLLGMMILKVGGNFVTKLFTPFSRFTCHMLYMMSYYFKESYLVKPLTSRPASSECYLVCKGFLGIIDEEVKKLLSITPLMVNNYKREIEPDVFKYDGELGLSSIESAFKITKDSVIGFVQENIDYKELKDTIDVASTEFLKRQKSSFERINLFFKSGKPGFKDSFLSDNIMINKLIRNFFKVNKSYFNVVETKEPNHNKYHFEVDYQNKITKSMTDKLKEGKYIYKKDGKIYKHVIENYGEKITQIDKCEKYKRLPSSVILKYEDNVFDPENSDSIADSLNKLEVIYIYQPNNNLINYKNILTNKRVMELLSYSPTA